MRAALAVLVAGLGLMLLAAPAGAHHAFAATYDTSKPVVIKGVITKIEFTILELLGNNWFGGECEFHSSWGNGYAI